MAYSLQNLRSAYEKLGVRTGQTLYVAADLSFLRDFEVPGKTAVLDAHYQVLRELIGSEGTLVVFSQSTQLCNSTTPFDLDLTPSLSGVLSEYVRTQKDAKRSFHPFCSFTAVGKNAEFVTQNVSRHAYGLETPMARMIDLNTLAISIGLTPNWTFNAVHHVEMMMGVPYRYTKEFIHPVVRNGTVTQEPFYLYVWYRGCDLKRDAARSIFEGFGRDHRVNVETVGAGQIYSYPLTDVFHYAVKMFRENIYAWLERPPEARPYQE